MREYTPDTWVVLEFTTPKTTFRKVFAGWYGGYTQGDSWKLNSGITVVTDYQHYYGFSGYSGSIYICNKNAYGMSGYMSNILASWLKDAETAGIQIKIIELADIIQS